MTLRHLLTDARQAIEDHLVLSAKITLRNVKIWLFCWERAVAIQYGFSSTPMRTVSLEYIQRIAENYARSVSNFDGYGHSMWASFSQHQASVVEAIHKNDMAALSLLLGNPSETDFLWGYDDLVKTFTDARMNTSAEILEKSARDLYVALVQVAIGIGAFNIPNVEANQSFPEVAVEEVLRAIDSVFGFKIEFPDCYAFRWGLVTERGIADYRSIQSIYQAWRTTQLAAAVGAGSVLEIGAGLGRNAYYAMRLGLPAYTIIDIPTTQIAQGHYLGLILGEDNVSLDDSEGSRPIRIRSPRWLRHTNEKFDVVVNADSLTEMDIRNSKEYIRYSSNNSRIFVSFNHEFNGHTVNELLKDASARVLSRAPYWPRPGYVEEIAIFGGH